GGKVGDEPNDALALRRDLEDLDVELGPDLDDPASTELAPGPGQRGPDIRVRPGRAQEQDFGLPAARSATPEPCGEDPCLVECDDVAGWDQLGQGRERSMRDRAVRAIEHEEPAQVASFRGRLRDEVRWKLEVEVGSAVQSAVRRRRRCPDGPIRAADRWGE